MIGYNELMQARTLTSQQVKRADKFQLEFVIKAADCVALAHAHAGALIGSLKIRCFHNGESGSELHVCLHGIFLLLRYFHRF